MGDLTSNKSSTDTTQNTSSDTTGSTNNTVSSSTDPWSTQSSFLSGIFQQAQNAYNTANTATAPTDYTATYTPDQLAVFQKMVGYGSGDNPVVSSQQNAGTSLLNTGSQGSAAAINDLLRYNPSGGTQSNIDAANAYAAGQDIPAQVDAAMLDAKRTASEDTLPSLYRSAAGSGNINSSKTAIAQGVVDRGLAEKAAALSAELRGNAYTGGLDLAEKNSEANNASKLAALSSVLSGSNSAAGVGTTAGNSSINSQSGLFDIANSGINNQQTAAQADLTNQLQQYQAAISDPFAALNEYYNIIGNKSWGSSTSGTTSGDTSSSTTGTATGTSDTTQTPSVISDIAGLMSAGSAFLPSSW